MADWPKTARQGKPVPMQIREETADRMVIEDRPWLVAVLLGLATLGAAGAAMATAAAGEWAGAAMLGLGALLTGGAITLFVRRTMLFLDRAAGVALIRTATVRGVTERQHPLSDLRGAVVQTSRSSKGPPARRPALVLADGRTDPLTPVYTSGRGAGRAVAAIERWLAGATRPSP